MKQANHTIRLKNLNVGFGQGAKQSVVLSDLNLQVKPGETIALLGLNGSGKSTLLRSIARLQPLLSGNIFINDIELNKWPGKDLARRLSFVSTEIINNNNLHVFDLVALGRFPHTNWSGKLSVNDREIIYDALSSVEISKYAYTRFNELSDGEKQRAMIARALAQDTPIIILDEPTAFLDLPHKYEIFRLLQEQSLSKGKSIIIAIHDINIAISEADKIWLASEGGIVEGAPEDLIIDHTIDSVFGKGKAVFDFTSGSFKVPRKHSKSIYLQAAEYDATWTKRALERLGFKVDCNKAGDLSVAINQFENRLIWELTIGDRKKTYNTIYDLSLTLKTLKFDNYG
ncbi:MAG: ABC transporter ATP-binding protein [Bacteroidota bacterium]|nr:ABC transporter ATP-binding protein [Bacteroidota bacterium]